ncbi:putative peptidyl-prolyl cis-trans isomerase [Candidatus Filomicrobium marinum]|nr:putative peptidyl-prolyl cis-trans isomerase [Candidatus Filomicrobium marinum]
MRTERSKFSAPPYSEKSGFDMNDTIRDGKFVELTYKVSDKRTRQVLTMVEFPLAYIHGQNEILSPSVHAQLEGRSEGEIIEVPLDGGLIFGARDESLVFTDLVENVPEEYREVGTSILMENDKGETRSFIVTKVDDETVTVDGNNPLCGREIVFTLEILAVREPTEEEAKAGGPINAPLEGIDPSLMRPV